MAYGNGTMNGFQELQRNYIFQGVNATITRRTKYVGTFAFSFTNIYQYPFDTERFSLKMVVAGNDYDFATLKTSTLHYEGK